MEHKTLPKGWEWTTLDSISQIILGQSPPSSTYNKEKKGLPFYQGKLDFGEIYPTPSTWCIQPKKVSNKGDVLISVRAPVGPTNICPEKSAIGRGLAAIRGLGGIDSSFILYLMRSLEKTWRGTGTTFDAIGGDMLRNLVIPLPPLTEQHGIVRKIEELSTRLDVGVDGLRKAQTQTKVYRQILMNAACMGKLTATWRKKNTREPAIEMLKRMLRLTEKELQLRAEGTVLPEIPDTWSWVNLRRIADIRQGVTKGRKFNGKKTVWLPYLRVANVQDGYLDLSEIKTIEALPDDLERYRLRKGDVLFNEGGDRDKLGRGCVWNEEVPNCIHQNHVFRARLVSGDILPEYLTIFSKSQFARNHFFRYASQTVNLASLNMTNLGNLPVAIPPSLEQKKIAEEVERQLSILDNLESTIRQNLEQAGMLRQSVLKTAFGGGLVSPGPADEPARLLLQRIQAEKDIQQQNDGLKIKTKVKVKDVDQRRLI